MLGLPCGAEGGKEIEQFGVMSSKFGEKTNERAKRSRGIYHASLITRHALRCV